MQYSVGAGIVPKCTSNRVICCPKTGDACSMYVLTWAEIFSGNKAAAFRLLKGAARAGFSPAVLDLAAVFQSKDRRRSLVTSRVAVSRDVENSARNQRMSRP